MKRIIVYADFDFLTSPEEIGTLGYEHVSHWEGVLDLADPRQRGFFEHYLR